MQIPWPKALNISEISADWQYTERSVSFLANEIPLPHVPNKSAEIYLRRNKNIEAWSIISFRSIILS